MRSRWPAVVLLAAAALLVALWWTRPREAERTALLMDTPVRVVVYAQGSRAAEVADAAISEIARLEALWHPERPDSDVARVNAAAGAAPVQVAPETVELASLARKVAEASGGAFDPTIGPLVDAWGFGEKGRVPTDAEREAAMALVDWRDLVVNEEDSTLFLTRPGMRLDLGGIAKGYAARLLRDFLAGQGVEAGLVQLGGSVALVGQKPGGGPWQIAVQHPRREGYAAVLSLTGGFVDTAGDYQRYFEQDGIRYHHILDPTTGFPARGVAAVTVLTQQGEWADAYATAAFVLGMDKGYQFLLDQGVEGLLISDTGEVRLTPGMAAVAELTVTPWPQ